MCSHLSLQVTTAKCSLSSRDRFEVVAAYHASLIEIFRRPEASGQYNPQTKVWSFSLDDHDLLLLKSRCLAPVLILTPLPTWVRDAFIHSRQSNPSAHLSIDLSRVEPHLRDQLMPFQKAGVQYGISRQGRVMIADDMGLGKTVQALGLASHYRDAWPLLIIAPSSTRFVIGDLLFLLFTFANQVCLERRRAELAANCQSTRCVRHHHWQGLHRRGSCCHHLLRLGEEEE